MSGKFKFAIDRGGTFTDVYVKCPNGKERVLKLLSVDPSNYQDAPREGIRRIMQEETGVKISHDELIDGSNIEWIRMGTTVATNALLERKGERMALVINEGFKDLLHIGNQARPKIFDLEIKSPSVLYEDVVEVKCRVIPASERCRLEQNFFMKNVTGVTKEILHVVEELDKQDTANKLKALQRKGIRSIAVVLMHSYTYQDDEIEIGKIAEAVGFQHVSLSHQIMPMIKIVSRGFTVCADAYLTPCIKQYAESFISGFKNNLSGVNVLFMQSDGGLTPMNTFNGSRAILSGPAGGVVGYAKTSYRDKAVIGFDMGGTSTDVSRFDGFFEHVFETTTAGITIQAPQLDVNTVAAGGGSRLFFRSGMFVVGPESAGAHPGPVCYRKMGHLAVTDANLVLGRLLPEFFPHIFGPSEDQSLDKNASIVAFRNLAKEINDFQANIGKAPLSIEEIALGFIKVANEAMCRPIRALTQAKGYDTRSHVLGCFGGAGGQHACSVSRQLGIRTVHIHKYAGVLSAYGMACADVVQEYQEPCALSYTSENFHFLDEKLIHLENKCREQLKKQGFIDGDIELQPFLHLRYEGTDCALMCQPTDGVGLPRHGNFECTFLKRYKKEFGFILTGRAILVDDIRIRGIGKSSINPCCTNIDERIKPQPAKKVVPVYYENVGHVPTNVFLLHELTQRQRIVGPAIIIDQLSTILIEPYCTAFITESMDIEITIGDSSELKVNEELDAIQLSIFSHRFMSIAEQMGRVLQQTSISTNIKERLDFSCALFGPDGGLVSNAPHIPVHLGAMQETVQYQLRNVGKELKKGDVLLSNHPKAGGSHLPDLTVITPVFYENERNPIFFVASRGHHADIGGITPGSMPPHSKSLSEEGATFKSFFLVKEGIFQEEKLIEALMAPSKVPGSSGTRNLADNLSDLKAQIASNRKGIHLVTELIDYYGLRVVQAYMNHIQKNAEFAVRNLLRSVGQNMLSKTNQNSLTACDYLDDGSKINLKISINPESGFAEFDFSGTEYEIWGNCNAPKAITLSAIIYCLRCMVGHDVPLNQGCLSPIKIIIPPGSLLDPSDDAAVVGGNVQTSQRIVDVIFKAFKATAASQGCMNNITFGQDDWGYYETVAGGAGAGPTWHGKSGVHVHMTNTRITDAEILERRYPVLLKQFSLRQGSGGKGKFNGGDGVVRKMLFRAPVMLSILTERRVFAPFGLEGGTPGAKGRNLLIKKDGRIIRLPSKTAALIQPGEIFCLLTPGGGGYGLQDNCGSKSNSILEESSFSEVFLQRGSVYDYQLSQESV